MTQLKKKRKSKRMRGHGMGSYGWGSRKKHISSGNKGGKGMAGTGKMAGHKKLMMNHIYGTGEYFGKQGITSRRTEKRINNVVNVGEIERDIETLKKKYGNNKEGILDMKEFKILGDGEIKIKVNIKALKASKSAIEKIEKAGGKVTVHPVEQKEAFVPKAMEGGKKSHKTTGVEKK
ncbi:MAG: uL15m family ribosomal protein [Nanoarchaeota archaeon]